MMSTNFSDSISRRSSYLLALSVLILCLVSSSYAAPPEPRTVRGYVYEGFSSVQVPSGTPVRINVTNTSYVTDTQTYGPPIFPGAYSASVMSTDGDMIYVMSWSDTMWGYNFGVMGPTRADIDVSLNITRSSEAIVSIINPSDSASFLSTDTFNISANVTIVGSDGLGCSATLSTGDPDSIDIAEGENYIHVLGDISRGTSWTEAWQLKVVDTGSSNLTVEVVCVSDSVRLFNQHIDTAYDIYGQDITSPSINIIYPENNTRVNTDPVFFFYNISDTSNVQNCSLYINDVMTNTTYDPIPYAELNFSYDIVLNKNTWYLECYDYSGNMDSSGVYNFSINAIPSITQLTVDGPVNLLAASQKQVSCNGTAVDGDGYGDIANIEAVLYHDSSGPSASDDPNAHYSNSSCTLKNKIFDTLDFECSFLVEYFATNGTWYCNATVTDLPGGHNSSSAATYVNELLAISVSPSLIDYGSLEIMQISPQDMMINLTNLGNIPIDAQVYSYAGSMEDNLSMVCDTGNISREYQRLSDSPSIDFELMSVVGGFIDPLPLDLDLDKTYSVSSFSTDYLYWKLQIPLRTAGRCDGKIVFLAFSG